MALIRITNTDGLGLPFGGGMFGSFPIATGVRVIGIRPFSSGRVICFNSLGGALLGQGMTCLPGPSLMLGLDGFQGSIFGPTQRIVRRTSNPFIDALDSQTLTVYHYTSKEGLAGILRDRVIRQSTDLLRDARDGVGVYFTTLSPDYPMNVIIRNNWDDLRGWNQRQSFAKKCECALEFQVPEHALDESSGGRDVKIFRSDFYIDNYPFKIIQDVAHYG